MDLGPPPARRPVCAILICLLGAARCSGDRRMCPCPEVPVRNDTQPPARSCFQVNDTFRYTCKEPNLRKAGTSNFIKCKQDGNGSPHWSPLHISLRCIADPNRTARPPAGDPAPADLNTTPPPESPVTAAAPSSPQRSSSEPTSPGLQAPTGHSHAGQEDGVRETEAPRPAPAASSAARAGIGFASLAIVGALIGLGFLCYKRRSNSGIPHEMPEEEFPMNNVPSEL
ncbi:uncharacterized protein LOC130200288 isoform X2 [Pseudoliparis swirei]|uniref:uncharacterized protein LOC130200288 isoform X2 n=1 Tax=Pseudoliparis swirei TaxID=2059687 RepID=UPI0024BDC2BA|nr:uncharacterized protein LOC130200288 isoform X2 [Pseudoliparis swirei]